MSTDVQTRTDKPETVNDTTDQPGGLVEHTGTAPVEVRELATPSATPSSRYLIIRVSQGGQSKAHIRIPLALARAVTKLIPHKEKEQLKVQGIDIEELLGELTGDEHGMLMQVEAEDGTSVWIGAE